MVRGMRETESKDRQGRETEREMGKERVHMVR